MTLAARQSRSPETVWFATAVLVTVLGTLTVGVADYARFYRQRGQVIAAAWAGARSGAEEVIDEDRPSVARRAALSVLGEDGWTIPVHVAASVWDDGTERFVTVEVRAPYADLLPILPKPGATVATSTWRVADGLASVP